MYLVKSPLILRLLYPSLVWKMPRNEKIIYLTFDDGPIPDVTEYVLKTLNDFNAKATFFCIGENIQKHPMLFEQLKTAGHAVGNHTFNHLRGWDTKTSEYIRNFDLCQELTQTNLFRPPYGRIKFSQIKALRKKNTEDFRIVMWDVLSGDYDPKTSTETCLKNVIKNTKNGSIVVFHDSLKAYENMKYALPKFLQHFRDLGYVFKTL